MKCALCLEREADKKNTHYLTDGIIRNCLNQEGEGSREKGLHYDLSTDKQFIDFRFQRSTSVEKIESVLGREPTEEEISASKKNVFSVDDVFCNDCEAIFSGIESKFIEKILPTFRENELEKKSKIVFSDAKLLRLFFLLQVWRTAVCHPHFKILENTQENLRKLILKSLEYNKDLDVFPISVIYLTTVGEQIEYTSNMVGVAGNMKNPYVIFMCDFLIQFYDNEELIKFDSFFGINNIQDFKDYINFKEESFVIKVLSNDDREKFSKEIMTGTMVPKKIKFYALNFITQWDSCYGFKPTEEILMEYFRGLTDWNDIPEAERMSEDRIQRYTTEFIKKKSSLG